MAATVRETIDNLKRIAEGYLPKVRGSTASLQRKTAYELETGHLLAGLNAAGLDAETNWPEWLILLQPTFTNLARELDAMGLAANGCCTYSGGQFETSQDVCLEFTLSTWIAGSCP